MGGLEAIMITKWIDTGFCIFISSVIAVMIGLLLVRKALKGG